MYFFVRRTNHISRVFFLLVILHITHLTCFLCVFIFIANAPPANYNRTNNDEPYADAYPDRIAYEHSHRHPNNKV